MNALEWNKKEELVADQALKHLKQYTSLLAALTENGRSELALLIKMQEYCYDNMNFLKVFQKIVVLFYKGRSWMTRSGFCFKLKMNVLYLGRTGF